MVEPNDPCFSTLVNRSKKPSVGSQGHTIARIVAIITHDSERFNNPFKMGPPTSDRPGLCHLQSSLSYVGLESYLSDPENATGTSDGNCGKLDGQQKEGPMVMLDWFIRKNPLSTVPKRVPECLDGELTLPASDESHAPVVKKQHRFRPEESKVITEKIDKLLELELIRPSKSLRATQVPCVGKNEGRLSLCVD